NKFMTLIYIHQYFKFPDEPGGTRSSDFSKVFLERGLQVEVVTTTSDKKYQSSRGWVTVNKDGLIVHYIYLPYSNEFSYAKRALIFLQFIWLSTFKVLGLNGDLVLATSTPLTIAVPALIKKWIGKTPFIFEVRDVWPEAVIAIGAIKNKWLQKLLYGVEKLIYKNAIAIAQLSTDMQKSIVSRYHQFKNKTNIVIENIAEINRFQNTSEVIDLHKIVGFQPRFSVLYGGTFGKVNGIHKVIELAEKTLQIDKGLVYILIGSGAEKENITQLAKGKGILNKNVFILNPISKKELPLWYSAVSMGSSFVIDIPELWRNSANKFFDTLAAGKPVLINHEGWQAKAIRKYNVGYVLPFKITEEVAKEFVDYTKNENLAHEQKESALKLAKEKYSLEVATESYLKIFTRI